MAGHPPGGVTDEAPYDIRFHTPSIAYLSGMEFDPIHEAQMSSRDRHASTKRGHFENDDPHDDRSGGGHCP